MEMSATSPRSPFRRGEEIICSDRCRKACTAAGWLGTFETISEEFDANPRCAWCQREVVVPLTIRARMALHAELEHGAQDRMAERWEWLASLSSAHERRRALQELCREALHCFALAAAYGHPSVEYWQMQTSFMASRFVQIFGVLQLPDPPMLAFPHGGHCDDRAANLAAWEEEEEELWEVERES